MSPTFRVLRKVVGAALAAGVLLAASTVPAQAADPPPNDDLANATVVTALPTTLSADVSAATTEEGENLSACFEVSHTVWYALTLPRADVVEIDTAGSDYDTALVVWPETTDGDVVTCVADTTTSLQARASFSAEAGRTYLVQVGVQTGELTAGTGNLQIAFRVAPRPTGRPNVFGGHGDTRFAGALWRSDSPTGWQLAQVDVTEGVDHDFRQPRPNDVALMQVQIYNYTTYPDGSWLAEEWFARRTLAAAEYRLHTGLRDAAVDVDLVLEYSWCSGPEPEVEEPVCSEISRIPGRVAIGWTGRGPTERAHEHVVDEGIGFRFQSTGHAAWRDAATVGSVVGDGVTLVGGEATIGVLGRAAVVQTTFQRGH